jgi:hypothetical protein
VAAEGGGGFEDSDKGAHSGVRTMARGLGGGQVGGARGPAAGVVHPGEGAEDGSEKGGEELEMRWRSECARKSEPTCNNVSDSGQMGSFLSCV